MTPEDAAHEIAEEMQAAFRDLGSRSDLYVEAVRPPPNLGPDTTFTVVLAAGRRRFEVTLPSTLALGYLADEEAAVDEWRGWIHETWSRRTMG